MFGSEFMVRRFDVRIRPGGRRNLNSEHRIRRTQNAGTLNAEPGTELEHEPSTENPEV